MNDPRPAAEQIAERVAEAAPTRLLPFLAQFTNMKQTLADHRRRVNDSHALQMKALGQTPAPASQGDDMGDTIVTGDIRIMQQPQQPQPAASGLTTLGKLGVGAALLTGGAGAGIVANEVLKDQPPAAVAPAEPGVDIDTDSWLNSDFGIETK